nr:hypothetical protein [Bacteroides faecium]
MGILLKPLDVIITVLLIAFLFTSLPQVNHKTRYVVLYPICGHTDKLPSQNSKDNYLIVQTFDIAAGYFCMHIAALLKFNALKYKNIELEN